MIETGMATQSRAAIQACSVGWLIMLGAMNQPHWWQAVGAAQGVLGLTAALAGVSAGCAADHCSRRDRTLRAFGILSLGESLGWAYYPVRAGSYSMLRQQHLFFMSVTRLSAYCANLTS